MRVVYYFQSSLRGARESQMWELSGLLKLAEGVTINVRDGEEL